MRTHSVFIKCLYNIDPKQRAAIIPHLKKAQIEVLSEVALNIYKGLFPNKQKYVKSLKRYRSVIHQIGSKSVGVAKKKKNY